VFSDKWCEERASRLSLTPLGKQLVEHSPQPNPILLQLALDGGQVPHLACASESLATASETLIHIVFYDAKRPIHPSDRA